MNEKQRIHAWIVAVLIMVAAIAGVYELRIREKREGRERADLVIYAYDSFTSYGLYPATIPGFQERYGLSVEVYTFGDAGTVLARAIAEKNRPVADIIVGVDNALIVRALGHGIFEPYTPANLSVIPDHLIFDPSHHVIPFDYGNIAVVYNRAYFERHNLTVPTSFSLLTAPEYRDLLIVQNPATSSTGMAFLLWTIAVYGHTGNYTYRDYWSDLRSTIYHVTDGWDAAYSAYLLEEAPMVVSYATDPAYSMHYYNDTTSGAIIMEDGGYAQIEGMGIVRNARNRRAAELYIEYMLSEDFQREIPLNNWMYPVNRHVELPGVYQHAETTGTNLTIPLDDLRDNYDDWLKGWVNVMGG